MPSFSSSFVSSLVLALLSVSVNGQLEGLIPAGLLDFIPDQCMPLLVADVLPCALENVCFSALPSDEEIATIRRIIESGIESCADVEEGLCSITSRCPPCKEASDDSFKCIVLGNFEEGSISQELTDLVMGCSLDCTTTAVVAEEAPSSEAPVEAPVEEEEEAPVDTKAPVDTEAPVEEEEEADPSDDSEAPVAAPVEEEEEAADGSGAMCTTRMASGVAILVGLVSTMIP